MENLTATWWEKDSSRDTATPEKNTLEVLVLFWEHCKWTTDPFCTAAPSYGILSIKFGIQQKLKLDLSHNGKNHSTAGWAGANRDRKSSSLRHLQVPSGGISRFLLKSTLSSSSKQFQVHPQGDSRFLLETSPGPSSRHLHVPAWRIYRFLLEPSPGSSSCHLWVPPKGISWVPSQSISRFFLETSPGSSWRHWNSGNFWNKQTNAAWRWQSTTHPEGKLGWPGNQESL